jgi:N-acetylmuramoyl-L-alanine amidase
MPFLTVNRIVSCFLIVAFLVLGNFQEVAARDSRAHSSGALYQKAQRSYYLLKSSKKNRAYRHQWVACAKKFIAVYENYPSSPQAYNALFTVARLYHQLYDVARNGKDRDRANHFYYKVISEFKSGRLTDDALMYQGKIYFDKKDYPAALSSFEKILRDFPRGDQAGKAKKLRAATIAFLPVQRVQKATNPSREVSPPPVRIKRVDYRRQPNSTQIVIHTEGPTKISRNRLRDPERVYFNFFNARLDSSIKRDIQVGGDVLTRLRVSQFDKTTSRLVLDIPANKGIKIVTSQDDAKVVIDVFAPTKRSITAKKSKPTPAPKPMDRLAVRKKQVSTTPKPVARVAVKTKSVAVSRSVAVAVAPRSKTVARSQAPLIIVDPGHGGKDDGATSPNGLLEKELNLDISRRLKKILETRYGYQVIMTRHDDTFIPLEERGEIANKQNADLFVSIHVNAAKRRSAHGIETYYLGVANSAQAQETAARENGELVHSVKDNQVQQILANMISTMKINASAVLASHVQERLHRSINKKFSGVKDLGVKEGPFFVLHDTNMPSILVEVGFITNPREERRLRRSDYLDRLASAIAQGVHEFKRDRGPTI